MVKSQGKPAPKVSHRSVCALPMARCKRCWQDVPKSDLRTVLDGWGVREVCSVCEEALKAHHQVSKHA